MDIFCLLASLLANKASKVKIKENTQFYKPLQIPINAQIRQKSLSLSNKDTKTNRGA